MRSKIYSALFTTIALLAVFKMNAQQLQSKTLTQIQYLVNEKASRTPAEKKISSVLLQAVREKQNVPMAQGVTTLRAANVNADKSGRLPVDIKGNVTDVLLAKIEALGGKIIYPSFANHMVRATVNLADVKTIAAFSEVKFIQAAVPSKLVDKPVTPAGFDVKAKKREAEVRQKLINYLRKNYPEQFAANSPVTSEGDRAHRADDARNTYGFSGAGIKIGVLSDSYNATAGAATDVLNGDLPGKGNPLGYTTPVTVLQDYSGGEDEGRAMLHIIHDIVPKAQLYFATADIGEAGFADNIKALRSLYGCDIIIDDVEYLDEPPFQDGMVAQAVNSVIADGAMYFASAGNAGSVTKNTSGVYEGDFNDEGSPAFVGDTTKQSGTINNFGTVATPITGDEAFYSGYYFLEWADPLGKSANDYDLFQISSAGDVVASSTDVQDTTGDPIEGFYATVSTGDRLVVFKTSSAKRRAFHLNAGFASGGSQGLAIFTNGQVFGHNCAAEAFSCAATPAAATFTGLPPGPYPNAFDTTDQVEAFSSDGPRRIFWNADSTPVTSGNYLFTTGGGLTRFKPDITAADGVNTQTTNTTLFDPFYGTSAAAPHAGAIAGLLKSANPDLTPDQIRNLLKSTALDIEAHGVDDVSGHGIIQAFQAMQKLNPKAYAVLNLDTSYVLEGSVSNGNGYVEAGETGNIVIGLKNTSLATATNVRAILTTTTTGVTILQDSVFYNNIDSNGGLSINTANPFIFKADSSLSCGTVLNFLVTVKYKGGQFGNKIFEYSTVLGKQPGRNIIATLGTPTTSANYTVKTGMQTGRVSRNDTLGVCDSTSPNPSLIATTGNRVYDAYTFTNTNSASQCVQVSFSSPSGVNLYCLAYNSKGFIADTPNVNFLGAQGFSGTTQIFNFDAPAGKQFTVVVHEVNSGTLTGAPYTLNVSLATCAQTVLAVNLFNLSAQADQAKQQIPLHWTVANDQQTRFYEIQRSTDGIHFSSLQTMASALSATQKTYNYIDKAPAYGDNYYRIKKVDLNGVISYSNIAKAALQISNDIVLMPNPASAYINVISKTSMGQVQLFNAKGQLLQTIKPQSSFYKLETSKLAAGQYFIRIQTNNGIVNEKFIKQ